MARIKPAFPAVTCTAQADYLTGRYPDAHGIEYVHPDADGHGHPNAHGVEYVHPDADRHAHRHPDADRHAWRQRAAAKHVLEDGNDVESAGATVTLPACPPSAGRLKLSFW